MRFIHITMDGFLVSLQQKIKNYEYFLWVGIFFLFVLYHYNFLNIRISDDAAYNVANLSFVDIVKKTYDQYFKWSSRIFSFFFVLLFLKLPSSYWFIADSFFCTLLLYSIWNISNLICNKGYKTFFVIFILFTLFIIFPFRQDMSTAGFICTTVDQFWPSVSLCYIVMIVCKNMAGVSFSLSYKKNAFYLFLLFFLLSFELTALFLFVFLSCLMLYFRLRHKQIDRFVFFLYVICIFDLIFILLCPGNKNRFIIEVTSWFPGFYSLNFFDKFNLGFSSTVSLYCVFFYKGAFLFFLFIILLTVNIFKLYSDFFLFCISLLLLYLIYKINFVDINYSSSEYMNEYSSLISFKAQYPLILSFFIVSISAFELFLVLSAYTNNLLGIFISFIFVLSIMIRVILGFSPTVFASSTRSFLIPNIFLLFINCLLICFSFFEQKKMREV